MLDRVNYIAKFISKYMNFFGASMIAVMMFLVTADVALRYLFSKPIQGSYEINELLMGVAIALSLAYTYINKGHIRVDVFVSRLSERTRAIIEIVMGLLGLGLLALLIWRNIIYVGEAIDKWYMTTSLHIPLYPFIILLTIGFIVFGFVVIVDIINSLKKVSS